ncbi:MAG: phosphotransferase [Proteobacteria bacterium]|nr:phosphotransferase [Pseudomonadota bacterium]
MRAEKLRALLSERYDIGNLEKITRLERGYVNTSYKIETIEDGRRNKYFLRLYKAGIKEEEIEFEHSIINHLVKKSFSLVAPLLRARDGKTYVKQSQDSLEAGRGEGTFLSVFEFLPGEDRYTWDNPACSDEELRSGAAVLAQYHDAVSDLRPDGRRYEPRIIDLLPLVAKNISIAKKKAGKTGFDSYFLENVRPILKAIDRIRERIDEKAYEDMVHLPIHCDYHPGNLKFQNENISGLFDFDWSKVDVRCFDVSLAITYFCSTWESGRDGNLELNKTAAFLETYQKTLMGAEGVGPLDEIELTFLPDMIAASNIYVLRWDLEDFYAKRADPDEYTGYLRHHVRVMRWLEDKKNVRRLEAVVRAAKPRRA